jgi:hypothetical protein
MPTALARSVKPMIEALNKLNVKVKDAGGTLRMSDCFRSFEQQRQAHFDYINGKKKAFSPNAFGGLHEAGRAIDFNVYELAQQGVSLKTFWELANPLGFKEIIAEPSLKLSECWHFDFRGSHQQVYDYYVELNKKTGGKNHPYQMMSISAILDVYTEQEAAKYCKDELLGDKKRTILRNFYQSKIQSILIRMNKPIGELDGLIGEMTKEELYKLVPNSSPNAHVTDPRALFAKVQLAYEKHCRTNNFFTEEFE